MDSSIYGLLSNTTKAETSYEKGQIFGDFTYELATLAAPITAETNLVRSSNYRTFYSVQGVDDSFRLMNGGSPWPSGVNKSVVGQGFYAWGTFGDAMAYRNVMSQYYGDLSIQKYSIRTSTYNQLNTLNLSESSISTQSAFMEQYSLYGNGEVHNYNHIIRPTNNFGNEYYFSPEAFKKMRYNGNH